MDKPTGTQSDTDGRVMVIYIFNTRNFWVCVCVCVCPCVYVCLFIRELLLDGLKDLIHPLTYDNTYLGG